MSRNRTLAFGIFLSGILGLYSGIRADTGEKTPFASQEPLVDPECSVVDVVTLDNRLIDVQPGDVFYLTASGPAGEKGVTIDLDNGEYGLVVRTGSRAPVIYDAPGVYKITCDVAGEHLKPIKVRVLAPPKDLDKHGTPGKQSSLGSTLMAATASSTPIGGSVGSVYAGVYPDTNSKFPIRICVSSGGDFTLTKYGGGWSQTWHFDAPGETTDVVDGPRPGENPWTLIKSGGGTHVLSTNSPSKLKINKIRMHSGPTYVAEPRADLTASNIYLAVGTPLVLVVDPGPGWASNNTPRTDQLYEWKTNNAALPVPCFAVSNSFSFSDPGTYVVSVECRSPTTPPQVKSLTINILKVESIKFQKSTMVPNWKTVDQVYKHLGVFTGQSATFGVNTTPSGITLPNDLLTWGGLASGTAPEVSVTFSAPNFMEAVTVTCGGTTKSAFVAIRDQPSGMGETVYAALHAVYTAIAMANNLIGTDVTTLEPFIWANSAYPGIQHNTVADAARHAYWTCLLTRYTVAGYAEGLTTQHEVSSPGPSTETVMDLHNNLMGISIEGDHTHTSGMGCCRSAVQNAVSAGTLWYLDSSYGAVNTAEDALLQPTNK